MEFNIVGLKVHYHVGQTVTMDAGKFKYEDTELPKYYICLKDKNSFKYELELWETYSECPSGYTGASFGNSKLTSVEMFGAITHVPSPDIDTMIFYDRLHPPKDYQCPWFEYSETNNDTYYPEGYCTVFMDNFIPTNRGFEKHPTWIFYGESNLGKSYIANLLLKNNLKVFETDSCSELPSKIVTDIIVIGNKHGYTLDDIKSRINGNMIFVSFSKK